MTNEGWLSTAPEIARMCNLNWRLPAGRTAPLTALAFPRPQVIFRYYNGRTGELKFAHSVRAAAD